jgi:hypothetical protein
MDIEDYLIFDIDKVIALQKIHIELAEFILSELNSSVNWNSAKQVKEYIWKNHNIALKDLKISTLDSLYQKLDHDSMAANDINGLMQLYKVKYMLKNYINSVLKHHENGKLTFRVFNGKTVMKNKQPLFGSEELWECVIGGTIKQPKGDRT